MNSKISKHAKDIIHKHTSGLFRNAALEFFGVKTAKIKELINVELPVVEVTETSTDYVFLLEDDSYVHVEFQTAYSKEDLTRFAMYDLRLYERDKRQVQTVIIYSSEVKTAVGELKVGSLTYAPDVVLMYEYDGNAIYEGLERKLKCGQELTDADMLNLIFLPLMRNEIARRELAEKTFELAQTIGERSKREACIAAAFAFSLKYMSDEEINEVLEVLRVINLDTAIEMLLGDTIEKLEKSVEDALYDNKMKIAKKLLKKGIPIEDIADSTGLDIETIKELQAQESEEAPEGK